MNGYMISRVNIFKGNIVELLQGTNKNLVITPHGYLLMNGTVTEDSFENIFETLNWSCLTEEKPKLLFSDIDTCGSGIIINIDDSSNYYLALSVGWKKFDSFTLLYEWYSKNWNNHGAMLKDKPDKCVTTYMVMDYSLEIGKTYARFIDIHNGEDTSIYCYLSIYGMMKEGIDISNIDIAEVTLNKYVIPDNTKDVLKGYVFKINRKLSQYEIAEKIKLINNMNSAFIDTSDH